MATQVGVNASTTVGATTSTSTARSVSHALSRAVTSTATRGLARTAGAVASTNLGASLGASFARASSVTATVGKNEGVTQTFTNHSVTHALELLTAQTRRLDRASALGMWDFAAYVLSEDAGVASNVAHSYLALTQGEDSHLSRAAVNTWRGDTGQQGGSARVICDYLKDLRHPVFGLNPALMEADPEEVCAYPATVDATTALSGKELAYSLNFPRSSVPGLPVIECARFGRTVSTYDDPATPTGAPGLAGGPARDALHLGQVLHMHHEEVEPVTLDPGSLTAHTFVTGSTGAGKTTTVCRLLEEANRLGVPYLVIEPAKGEYKDVLGGRDDVTVYGTNPAITPLLRINPFSFPEGIHVLEHLDRLIEIFNVCWPMYAAMPAVLKDAVERSYTDCGWDLMESTNPYGRLFPGLPDVARNVRLILDTSEYDAENKGAYKGSLLTRLSSLGNGLAGAILTDEDVDPAYFLRGNTIVDLSRVGSSETTSLLMGLLVLTLQEVRMAEGVGTNLPLRHLTVLEEAHHLLRRSSAEPSGEGGNLTGRSVEMLANAIAEMRTYGEGFVIADQSPGLLDMSVIRNTNTKVIMRLPDLADRELVGKAANLTDEQVVELARLPRGAAAVYQNDWVEPVLCKVIKPAPGQPYRYTRPARSQAPDTSAEALLVASALASPQVPLRPAALREVREALTTLHLPASLTVTVRRLLEQPPAEPRMVTLAPVITALLPSLRRVAEDAVDRDRDAGTWSHAVEEALADLAPGEVGETTRRVIVQGIMTDLLRNHRHDEAAFNDWYAHADRPGHGGAAL